MSRATQLLQAEIDSIDQQIAELERKRTRHTAALDALGPEAARDPIVPVRGLVSDEQLKHMRRDAGRANVEAVYNLLRSVQVMSQRDLSTQLNKAPGTISKAVRALEAAGKAFPAGKDVRSPLWTTKPSVAQRAATAAAADDLDSAVWR